MATPAHTSLAIYLTQWRGEIGRYFGFGRSYSLMTSSQKADVDAVIDRGLRQFYAPPVLKDGSAHIWSFMRPVMGIAVHAPYSTGLLTDVAPSPPTATFSGTTLPTWIQNGCVVFNHPTTNVETILHIKERSSNTLAALDDAVTSDQFSGGSVSYYITDGIYDLPTSFGGIEGDVILEAGSGYMPVRQVSDQQIREMFLNGAIQTGVPAYFCVRPRRKPDMDINGSGTLIAQYTRYEMVFFPRPDKDYRMSFRYLYVFPGVDDMDNESGSSNDKWMPGLAYHHEAILASCLAVAEEYADSPNGQYKEYFRNRIEASAALDRKMNGSPFLGQNNDRSDTLYSQGRAPLRTQITFNNVLY